MWMSDEQDLVDDIDNDNGGDASGGSVCNTYNMVLKIRDENQ